MASLEKQRVKRVCVPAGRLVESKAESRDCSWASGSKVLKAPGGGSHRLRVSPDPWLRSLTSLGMPPWFWHAQPHPGHPFGAATPRNQCVLCFSLLVIPGPVSGPSWALAGGLNRKKKKRHEISGRVLGTVFRSTLETGRQSKSTGLDVHENSSLKETPVSL